MGNFDLNEILHLMMNSSQNHVWKASIFISSCPDMKITIIGSKHYTLFSCM